MSTVPQQAGRADRDRFVDALRVLSLVVVIVGHWLMADVSPDGEVGNALASASWLEPATWLLQVMPLFFLVGGVAHAYALESLHRRVPPGPGRYATFAVSRARRLLRPTAVLVGLWVLASLALHAAGAADGADGELVRTALRLVTQPLWFVGIYLGVAALAPPMLAAHRRAGAWVVLALATGACAVDLLRFGGGVAAVATLNYALVWLTFHQLGFCLRDGLLTRARAAALVAGGTLAAVLLVALGPYPVSMVGLPGQTVSNMSPPTVALLAQGTALVGVAVLLRGPVTRALARPRVWTAVLVVGSAAMTAFLWHLTALFLAVQGLRWAGITPPPAASPAWWATRPPWLLLLTALTLVLVLALRRFERVPGRGPVPRTRGADVLAASGAALCSVGVLMVSVTGVDVLAGAAVRFVVLDVAPRGALGVLLLGAGLVALAGMPARPGRAVSPPRPAARR